MTLKRKKSIIIKTVNRVCVKEIKYIDNVKNRLVWVFCNRERRDKDSKTGLKEGEGIKIETTVLHSL